MRGTVYTVNTIAFLVIEVAIGIFDATRELGSLHGALFALWTLYAGTAFGLVNGVIAAVMAVQDRPARPFVVSAVAAVLAALLFASLAAAVTT